MNIEKRAEKKVSIHSKNASAAHYYLCFAERIYENMIHSGEKMVSYIKINFQEKYIKDERRALQKVVFI